MQPESGLHSTEDLLEEYAFGYLSEEQDAEIEEHLLVCELCQARLTEIDGYVNAAKTAALSLMRGDKISRSRFEVFESGNWWQIPKPGWTVGFAALAVC